MSRNSQVFYNIFCTKATISVQKKRTQTDTLYLFACYISCAYTHASRGRHAPVRVRAPQP